MVEAQLRRREALQHGGDRLLVLGLERHVHQPGGGAPHQVHRLAQDVQRHQDGQHRIQPGPAGEQHADQPGHDADRGPDIGEEVARVGFQRDRAVLPRRPQHLPGQRAVDRGAHQRQHHAHAQRLQRLRRAQPLDRGPADPQRGDQDQRALEGAGEILRLVVAEGVVLVGRAAGDGHHRQAEERAGQVHPRFEGVRQQAHRARPPPGGRLQGDGQHRHEHRELQVLLHLHGADFAGPRMAPVRLARPPWRAPTTTPSATPFRLFRTAP